MPTPSNNIARIKQSNIKGVALCCAFPCTALSPLRQPGRCVPCEWFESCHGRPMLNSDACTGAGAPRCTGQSVMHTPLPLHHRPSLLLLWGAQHEAPTCRIMLKPSRLSKTQQQCQRQRRWRQRWWRLTSNAGRQDRGTVMIPLDSMEPCGWGCIHYPSWAVFILTEAHSVRAAVPSPASWGTCLCPDPGDKWSARNAPFSAAG
jgi:hypothetical protein